MIDRIKLQQQIYKIASDSVTDEERKFLNLKDEQIIPTLILFNDIKWQLTAGYMIESNDYEELNEEILWKDVKDKEKINMLFLGVLCIRDGINFEITKDGINISWHISLVEKDISKKYHL